MIRKKLTYVVTSILIVAFITSSYWILYSPNAIYVLPFSQEHALGVSEMFVSALADNQTNTLKSLTETILIPRIDDWKNNHEATKCHGAYWWEPLDVPVWEHVVLFEDNTKRKETLLHTRTCYEQEKLYCIVVEDIDLINTEDGWTVRDWGEVYEEITSKQSCHRK